MQQPNGNLISNDPLVSVIFNAIAREQSEPYEKLRAIYRAGMIAEAYLGQNISPAARQVVSVTFNEAVFQSSPSELPPVHCSQSQYATDQKSLV